MKTKIVILSLAFFIVGFSACTKIITLDETKIGQERLVIYGYITNETTQHAIRITRSAGYFATTSPEGVQGATVTISSEKEVFRLRESKEEPGLYLTDSTVCGKEGSDYFLEVSVDFDRDGEEELFTASSYLPYSAQPDSIRLEKSIVFKKGVDILIYGKIPSYQDNYIRFHAYKNDIHLSDSTAFIFTNATKLAQTVFHGIPCYFIDLDYRFTKLSDGDTVTLHIDMLPRDYYYYMQDVSTATSTSIPLFSGPPANIESNIKGVYNPKEIPIAGYFSSFSKSKAVRIFEEEKK